MICLWKAEKYKNFVFSLGKGLCNNKAIIDQEDIGKKVAGELGVETTA